jgi:hypothetical protein
MSMNSHWERKIDQETQPKFDIGLRSKTASDRALKLEVSCSRMCFDRFRTTMRTIK